MHDSIILETDQENQNYIEIGSIIDNQNMKMSKKKSIRLAQDF